MHVRTHSDMHARCTRKYACMQTYTSRHAYADRPRTVLAYALWHVHTYTCMCACMHMHPEIYSPAVSRLTHSYARTHVHPH